MKIGFVTDFYYPWIGGPAALIRQLAHGLQERGHDVSLLVPSPTGPAYREVDDDVAITRVRTFPSPIGHELRLAPLPLRAVARWLNAERPDVVHVHHPFPLSATAALLARRRGIPVVATNHTIPECSLWGIRGSRRLHGLIGAIFARWIVFLLDRCDLVATPTETAAKATRDLGYGGSIRAISNGIDTKRFSPIRPSAELRERLGLDDRPIVLYTGRLDAEKQMDVWLQAAAKVNGPVQFVVGGEGADRGRLEALARRLGLSGRLTFTGYVPSGDLADLYGNADIYFITSPVELQSISTLEAIASGLPVVAVNAGALPELIHEGENGFLFDREDTQAAARAIDSLLADRPRRRRMGEESRKLALQHDLSESIDQYEEFLGQAARLGPGERSYERGGIVWS